MKSVERPVGNYIEASDLERQPLLTAPIMFCRKDVHLLPDGFWNRAEGSSGNNESLMGSCFSNWESQLQLCQHWYAIFIDGQFKHPEPALVLVILKIDKNKNYLNYSMWQCVDKIISSKKEIVLFLSFSGSKMGTISLCNWSGSCRCALLLSRSQKYYSDRRRQVNCKKSGKVVAERAFGTYVL